ncbi:MAG TPA: hypothetical protein VI814_04795 [Candidatus Limnocylindria bacterium]
MHERRDDLVDETLLRRALRLDAEERAPRFDPAAIAALARPRLAPAHALGLAVLAVAVAVAATTFWWNVITDGPALFGEAVSVALDGLALVASFLYPALEAFADPAVPLSLLVALGITIVYEMRTRRGRVHAEAS